jgi:addiction module HigA family antidote
VDNDTPFAVVHPREHLQEFIEEAGLNAARLAAALHVPRNRVTRILNGECGISLEMAHRLGRFFGQSPQFWLNMQLHYEKAIAERDGLPSRIAAEIVPYAWGAHNHAGNH